MEDLKQQYGSMDIIQNTASAGQRIVSGGGEEGTEDNVNLKYYSIYIIFTHLNNLRVFYT